MNRSIEWSQRIFTIFLVLLAGQRAIACDPVISDQRLLYVASPGVRDNLEWGGHGVLIFDIANQHKFVQRIPLNGYGLNQKGAVLNVKGICASAKTNRL